MTQIASFDSNQFGQFASRIASTYAKSDGEPSLELLVALTVRDGTVAALRTSILGEVSRTAQEINDAVELLPLLSGANPMPSRCRSPRTADTTEHSFFLMKLWAIVASVSFQQELALFRRRVSLVGPEDLQAVGGVGSTPEEVERFDIVIGLEYRGN